MDRKKENNRGVEVKNILKLIILLGLISLFGDIIYEGSRSVNGPYLQILGASAAVVGIIVGIGEFLGYGIRLIAGYFSDKTKAYWFFTMLGYGLIFSIPMLSIVGTLQIVTILIIIERIGKGIRTPARDVILSQATKQVGTGFGFGIHEFFDQIGAIVGPLIFVIFFSIFGSKEKTVSDYQKAYCLLWIPFILLMSLIFITYFITKKSGKIDLVKDYKTKKAEKLPVVFWLYIAFSFFTTTGFVSFALIGFHIKVKNIFPDVYIPLLYMTAMAVDGVFALIIGKLYDQLKDKRKSEKAGLLALISIPVLSIFIPILAFSIDQIFIIISVILWGLVMSSHETIMKSAIADTTPLEKRGTAYGVFTTLYGLAVFTGTAMIGLLYDYSLPLLVTIIFIVEIISIPIFLAMWRACK